MHRKSARALAATTLVAALAGCTQQDGGQYPPPLPPPVRDPNPPVTPVPVPDREQQRAEAAEVRLRGEIERMLGEHPITFEPDSAVLTPDAARTIPRLAELLKSAPERVRFEIGGNAARVASPANAQQLSDQRARAVVDALVGAGVPADRLRPVGYGNSRATGDPNTARRVDVVIR